MSVSELKLEIIKKLTAIEDEQVLEKIFRLVFAEEKMEAVYKLFDEEIKLIQPGLKDAEAGLVYSSEEAKQMVRQWLKE